MVEARIACLERLLAGHKISKLSESANVSKLAITSAGGNDANDQAATTIKSVKTTAENEHNRVPLAAGPLARNVQGVPSTYASVIEPVYTPPIPLKGDLDRTTDPRCGDPSPLGIQFCPILAVAKWPYKFVDREYMQPIATAFFDAEKIWNREWDLYYIWSADSSTSNPVTFVTSTQFQALIDDINTAFPDLNWRLTNEHTQKGLLINFTSPHCNLRPRWLGHSNSRERHDLLRDSITQQTKTTTEADPSDILAFQDSIELAFDAARNRPRRLKQSGETTPESIMVKLKAAQIQLDHAYHHLGLSRAAAGTSGTAADPALHQSDVIFISIDIEAYERDHSKVTEVGVSTLDTRDLLQVAMGHGGRDWRKAVRARHFLIHEHKHLVNHAFVRGCPGDFDFGTSESVGLADLPKVLTSCLHHPYSKLDDASLSDEPRKIVIIGHDIGNDIKYCHQIGFSILNRSSIIEVLDTAIMYRAFTKDNDQRSLGTIMLDFDLDAWHLHNAGNDAVYTMWALLGMCCGANLKPEVECDEDLQGSG
ncbi:hypothetical protein AMS68_000995 [Peltaster fructicola]|uniref:Gfd2/YDR514C-like C-terminal domain-containing protein n=1 Tax=Peltaster fructicola TaxID=286661 RepID=A0A6H0XLH5_9PEZI|nr:hypothetical protein AMS68_000995 [Peltaster fructicola]